jgi:hypothetical protein
MIDALAEVSCFNCRSFELLPIDVIKPGKQRLTFSIEMRLKRLTSGAVPRTWGTATERWRRHGAFFGTKVLEDVISASAEVNKRNLHGQWITAA